jgi:hypothetical protein
VQGEDDKETVTVGSVVTLKVILKRSSLLDSKKRETEILEGPVKVEKVEQPENEQPKRKVWEKQKPKKKTNKGKGGKKVRYLLNFLKEFFLK